MDEWSVAARGMTNYWGYSTLGVLRARASDSPSKRGAQVTEFKTMVKALHRAGIEVVLDVVYNHTGRRRSPRAHGVACAGSTTRRTTGFAPTTARSTTTSPAAATA